MEMTLRFDRIGREKKRLDGEALDGIQRGVNVI